VAASVYAVAVVAALAGGHVSPTVGGMLAAVAAGVTVQALDRLPAGPATTPAASTPATAADRGPSDPATAAAARKPAGAVPDTGAGRPAYGADDGRRRDREHRRFGAVATVTTAIAVFITALAALLTAVRDLHGPAILAGVVAGVALAARPAFRTGSSSTGPAAC
jgi:hypothetical protein